MNPFKYWEVIKDDSKRTFEVIGQSSNTNAFTNQTYAMQRNGMNVSCVTPPVGGKLPSKSVVTVSGYCKEDGLYERLLKEYRAKMMSFDDEEFLAD